MPKVEFGITSDAVKLSLKSKRMLRSLWKELDVDMDFETLRQLYTQKFEEVGDKHVRAALKQLQAAAGEARDGVLDFMRFQVRIGMLLF